MLAHIAFNVPFYLYFLLFFLYSLVIFWGCVHIQSGFFMPILCKANTTKKEIALSFDDGPSENFTPHILQLLKNENIEATFFCIGNRIKNNENIVKQIYANGHTIGNHSYSHHFWFDMFSSQKMLTDLQLMDESIHHTLGLKPKLFRPPYGVMNPNLKKAILNGNYIPIGWNVRSLDTNAKNSSKLLHKITSNIKPGAIFLFHDTCEITLQVLPEFIAHAKKNGYVFVRVDKMLTLQPYA